MALLEKALAASSRYLICIQEQNFTFFIGLVLYSSSPKQINMLRISKPQKWGECMNNEPQTKFTGSYKKGCIYFVNNK